jgi:AcrR family transcriptional regulator
VEQVADQLDVTKGSIYYYFPSKDELGTAAIETVAARLDRAPRAATRGPHRPGEPAAARAHPRAGTRIVTHLGPISAQRHEPHHQAIADYRCTVISEEPVYLSQGGPADWHPESLIGARDLYPNEPSSERHTSGAFTRDQATWSRAKSRMEALTSSMSSRGNICDASLHS